jgi:hypothetical protein
MCQNLIERLPVHPLLAKDFPFADPLAVKPMTNLFPLFHVSIHPFSLPAGKWSRKNPFSPGSVWGAALFNRLLQKHWGKCVPPGKTFNKISSLKLKTAAENRKRVFCPSR